MKSVPDELRRRFGTYVLETCRGASFCRHAALGAPGVLPALENMLSVLAQSAPVFPGAKPHHALLRVSISFCPNGCSRPQIADIGLLGACLPCVTDAGCSLCGACADVCREGAVELEPNGPVIDAERCLACGACAVACPTGSLTRGREGFRVQVGGRLGRHPRLARELPGVFDPDAAQAEVARYLEHHRRNARPGERMAALLERAPLRSD